MHKKQVARGGFYSSFCKIIKHRLQFSQNLYFLHVLRLGWRCIRCNAIKHLLYVLTALVCRSVYKVFHMMEHTLLFLQKSDSSSSPPLRDDRWGNTELFMQFNPCVSITVIHNWDYIWGTGLLWLHASDSCSVHILCVRLLCQRHACFYTAWLTAPNMQR